MNRLTDWLIKTLGGVTLLECHNENMRNFDQGRTVGLQEGKALAKVQFAVLPLPFSEAQLRGRDYGTFITPAGFAVEFGECNIPAPGQHGYEHHARYVSKASLVSPLDIVCQHPEKFDKPWDSDALVPVIVTVLR